MNPTRQLLNRCEMIRCALIAKRFGVWEHRLAEVLGVTAEELRALKVEALLDAIEEERGK